MLLQRVRAFAPPEGAELDPEAGFRRGRFPCRRRRRIGGQQAHRRWRNFGGTRSVSSSSAGTVDAAGNPVGSTAGRSRALYTLGASAGWELDLWGRVSGAVDAAQATALAAERTLLDVRNRRLAAVGQLLKNIAGRWEPV